MTQLRWFLHLIRMPFQTLIIGIRPCGRPKNHWGMICLGLFGKILVSQLGLEEVAGDRGVWDYLQLFPLQPLHTVWMNGWCSLTNSGQATWSPQSHDPSWFDPSKLPFICCLKCYADFIFSCESPSNFSNFLVWSRWVRMAKPCWMSSRGLWVPATLTLWLQLLITPKR